MLSLTPRTMIRCLSWGVDKETRSRMMSGIHGKNTKPEMLIRKGLHALGFRYRLHSLKLPGKPDIILPKYRAIILINGCFWHAHNCHLFKWPSTRKEFWEAKILSNKKRDLENLKQYSDAGWKTLVIWAGQSRYAGLFPKISSAR